MRPSGKGKTSFRAPDLPGYNEKHILSALDEEKKTIKSKDHKMPECRTHRCKVFAVIYAKHKIAIKSRYTIT